MDWYKEFEQIYNPDIFGILVWIFKKRYDFFSTQALFCRFLDFQKQPQISPLFS